MPLGDFYSRYPALGGYEAGRQMVIGDQQRELGDAQKMLTLASLLQQQRADSETRDALRQSGGDAEAAVAAALKAGNVAAAAKLTPLAKQQSEERIRKSMMEGVNNRDPNYWYRASVATGKPEYATHGERLQKELDAVQEAQQYRSGELPTPQGGAGTAIGVAPTEEEAIARLKASPGVPMTLAVGQGGEGLFGTLLNSSHPEIAAQARNLQTQFNKLKSPNSAALAFYRQKQSELAAKEAQFSQQQNMRSVIEAGRNEPPVQLVYKPRPDGLFDAYDVRKPSAGPVAQGVLPPGQAISPTVRADAAYAGEAGKVGAKEAHQLYESAESANDVVNKSTMLINHIKGSKAITGLGAEIIKNIERAKVLIAGMESSGEKVSDTEFLNAMMGSEVFPMIKALGIGARGLDTPAEREFLREVMTGTVPLNKQTLLRMAELRRTIALRELEKWNRRVDSGSLDSFFTSSKIPKQRFGKTGQLPNPGGASPPQERTVVRTGTYQGRKVVEYSDGTVDYAAD